MSIRESVSAKLERLIRRSMADEQSRSAAIRDELRAVHAAVSKMHQEVFEWCGDLAARSREALAQSNALSARCEELAHRQRELTQVYLGLSEQLASIEREQAEAIGEVRQIVGASLDDVPGLVQRLFSTRGTSAYRAAFAEAEPMVSVIIATYNRARLLTERTLPSVLGQTYSNFEVVIVGDGCDDDTADRLAAVSDPRIRFFNLPHRTGYPDDPRKRWQVAGGSCKNLAAELAEGHWLALVDDDDEFSPDHIEILMNAALGDRYEMVCGRMMVKADRAIPYDRIVGTYPPKHGEFNFFNSIMMRALRFFTFDSNSWVLDEASDWQRCRRMMEAGVKIGWVEDVLGTVYPTGPREEGVEGDPPEPIARRLGSGNDPAPDPWRDQPGDP